MGRVIDVMMNAIRNQVCGSQNEIDTDISPEEMSKLYAVSKSQDLAHLVAAELEKNGVLKDGDEISEKFRKQHLLAVIRYERINYELEEICRVLEKGKIQHIPLKGAVLRKLYPEPWMRTSADIDLLVHEEDLTRATELLVNDLGYDNGGKKDYDVQMFAPSGVHVELHFNTVEEDKAVRASEVLEEIWEYSTVIDGWRYRYQIATVCYISIMLRTWQSTLSLVE